MRQPDGNAIELSVSSITETVPPLATERTLLIEDESNGTSASFRSSWYGNLGDLEWVNRERKGKGIDEKQGQRGERVKERGREARERVNEWGRVVNIYE